MPHLGFGQLVLGVTPLAVERGLGGLMPLELPGDGGRVAAELLDDTAESRLVVGAHLAAHRGRGVVAGAIELLEPLLEARPGRIQGLDALVTIRVHVGHGETILSAVEVRRAARG